MTNFIFYSSTHSRTDSFNEYLLSTYARQCSGHQGKKKEKFHLCKVYILVEETDNKLKYK